VTQPDTASAEPADRVRPERALISVSDKRGVDDFARALHEAGVEIVSTGSTAARIREAGVPVTDVSEITGFPESLDGRVKTLHPAVHAGILADTRRAEHMRELNELGIEPFQIVAVNLYPFVQTVESGAESDEIIEQIDIGGPALVRASAKNHASVAIATSPDQYAGIADAVRQGGTTLADRRRLAAAAFAHTAAYDTAVAAWFAGQTDAGAAAGDETGGDARADGTAEDWPASISVSAELAQVLRYGENSHQRAALYRIPDGRGIAQAEQLHGKELSYNNLVDADAAYRTATDFPEPAVAIIKHANPCGVAVSRGTEDDAAAIADAHRRAHACDPVSAYGGVVAANRPVSAEMAETLSDIFTEVVIAPGFDDDALEVLMRKKNVRLLRMPEGAAQDERQLRHISGGLLVQEIDRFAPEAISASWNLVAGNGAVAQTLRDLEFAWVACRSVKSNAILLAADAATVGVGMGQVNRVDSCELAVRRAGERARGSVAASDAFFPFADGAQVLIDAGVRAIVQPGGSIRDDEVIEAARAAGVTMYFTGERHFFH